MGRPKSTAPKPKFTYLYFVACEIGEDGTACKIGLANSPRDRLFDLQSGSPVAIHPQDCFPVKHECERIVHAHFKHLRIRGEWFHWHDDMEELMDDLMDYLGVTDGVLTGNQMKFILSTLNQQWDRGTCWPLIPSAGGLIPDDAGECLVRVSECIPPPKRLPTTDPNAPRL